MFGKKTKKLQHKVAILEMQVNTINIRLDGYRNWSSDLQAKYTALLEKLGLEEVEIKAGIKLVEKKP